MVGTVTRTRWADATMRRGDAPLSALAAAADHACFHVWQLALCSQLGPFVIYT